MLVHIQTRLLDGQIRVLIARTFVRKSAVMDLVCGVTGETKLTKNTTVTERALTIYRAQGSISSPHTDRGICIQMDNCAHLYLRVNHTDKLIQWWPVALSDFLA